MGAITQTGYGTLTSYFSSGEINSLAAGAYSAQGGWSIDNTAGNLYLACALDVTFATAPAAGGYVGIFLMPDISGWWAFPDGSASVVPQPELMVGSFSVRASTSAQWLVYPRIIAPPGYFNFMLYNGTTQAFNADPSFHFTTWTETVA